MRRRDLLRASAAWTAASYSRVFGANDRVRIAGLGVGGRATYLLGLASKAENTQIVAVCDVSEPRRVAAKEKFAPGGKAYVDYREVLERTDIDAVVIGAPDHWHVPMTVDACNAGKDVYVEKPLTHVHREGEWMLDAATTHKRIVQVGTQQRSGRHYQRARTLIRDGQIGDVRGASIGAFRNITPGFTTPVGSPLSPAQWDMWLGPAPKVPFDPARSLYHFRWFNDYSGGQTTNLLAHEIDIVQWVTGEIPARVAAFAQRRSLTGYGETPDVLDAIFEYPTFLASWSSREVAAGGKGGLEIYGTKGTLSINRRGFEITPDRALTPESQIPRFTQPQAETGPVTYRTEGVKDEGYDQVRDQFQPHVRNFLDAIKSRQPPASDLTTAHQTSLACHLANIAARLGRVVRWDAAANAIAGDPEANALLTKTYRAPWDRELASVVKVSRA